MTEENAKPESEAPSKSGKKDSDWSAARLREAAEKPAGVKPPGVSDREWRRHRIAAGHMVIIRSHFKSIYLIPMALISLFCGVALTVGDPAKLEEPLGLVWTLSFCFYMNIFIFEWSRAWTWALIVSFISLLAVGFAVNDPVSFPVWHALGGWFRDLNLGIRANTGYFFAVFFGLCAMVSVVRTRLNYLVVEHNEILVYRNAIFGDRQRLPMLNRRIMVRVPDMLEYFHPGYNAGQIIIHAQDGAEGDLVLDNVLGIRRIERAMDRLGSSLAIVGGHS